MKNALVLSGGGARGSYEIGVWQALKELHIPLHIVTGTSVGAINGAMVVLDSLEAASDFWSNVDTSKVFDMPVRDNPKLDQIGTVRYDFKIKGMPVSEALDYIREILSRGGVGNSALKTTLYLNVDETSLRNSPIDYGLVVTEFPNMTPCFAYKEDMHVGMLHDYILSSASCFPATKFHKIGDKKYVDGGYSDNMPVKMALDKGATNIIAVDLEAAGVVNEKELKEAQKKTDHFVLIKSAWDLGNFLYFDPEISKRNMKLGRLDALKALEKYNGYFYTFEKDIFDAKTLKEADTTAKIFELDPFVIYTKEDLNFKLTKAVEEVIDSYFQDGSSSNMDKLKVSLNTIEALRKAMAPKVLTCFMARDIRKKENDSIFLSNIARSIFKDELRAAHYIMTLKLL